MKKVKLFEEFHTDLESANEGMMSEIDIIGQNSSTKEEFLADVKKFLLAKAANPKVATEDSFLEDLAKTYFNENGSKKENVD